MSKEEIEPGADVERNSLLLEDRRAHGLSPFVREVLHWISHAVLVSLLVILALQQNPSTELGAETRQAIDVADVVSSHGHHVQDPSNAMAFTVQKGDGICSGHGTKHTSGSQSWCVCFDCWQGGECDQPSNPCFAVAMAGDPMVFEDYWVQHKAPVEVDSGFKLGYMLESGTARDPFVQLTQTLKSLHSMVGNIDTTDTHFVFGCGGTHLLAAALYAQSKHLAGGGVPNMPVKVWEKRPYFGGHRQAGTEFETAYFAWQEERPPPSESASVVEFVCGPNNPDGELRRPAFNDSRVVWDMAYRWPLYTPIAETAVLGPNDIALFTISKVSGHAGTRFGWAITRNPQLARYMKAWVGRTTLNVPRDTAYRASALLSHMLRTDGAMLDDLAALMAYKWDRLHRIFAGSSRFRLQPTMEPAQPCLFAQRVKAPTPAYAWIQCVGVDAAACDGEPTDYFGGRISFCGCSKVLKDAGVFANAGAGYGASNEWVRVQLLQRKEDFDLLAGRLEAMVQSPPVGP